MHFSQILNSGERQKIYHKNADDGAHQINHPVRKLFHFTFPITPVRLLSKAPPVRTVFYGLVGDGKVTIRTRKSLE